MVGENGSGKSTLMRIVVGVLASDAGQVERLGRLGYCPQTPMLWDKLTIDEHFALFARAYGMDDELRDTAASELASELRFQRYRGYRVEELSGGTRQKLNLALALMHEPQVLLLDEPYSGFDWETYQRFWELSETRATRAWASSSSPTFRRTRTPRSHLCARGWQGGGAVSAYAATSESFVREQLRAPLTLVSLVMIPVFFVLIFAGVLGQFADALGGTLATQAATAISARWAAAFLSGALVFFQVSSSRGADRRLAAAGFGPSRVAVSRITAALVLGVIVSAEPSSRCGGEAGSGTRCMPRSRSSALR